MQSVLPRHIEPTSRQYTVCNALGCFLGGSEMTAGRLQIMGDQSGSYFTRCASFDRFTIPHLN